MGYYTRYKLEVSKKLQNLLEDNFSFTYGEGFFEELLNGAEPCKWYDHHEEMTSLSKQYPDILFTLRGIGEETEDNWIKYYKGGKCQIEYAKITFGEFDAKKLK